MLRPEQGHQLPNKANRRCVYRYCIPSAPTVWVAIHDFLISYCIPYPLISRIGTRTLNPTNTLLGRIRRYTIHSCAGSDVAQAMKQGRTRKLIQIIYIRVIEH